jgi:O-antigen ligase
MKPSTTSTLPAPAGWLITLALLPVAAMLGFGTGDSLLLVAAGALGLLACFAFFAVPLSVPVKLMFLLITVTFLQKALGYFKVGEVRGLNFGNLLLVAAGTYWLVSGYTRGRIYVPTPLDFWLCLYVLAFPLFSIAYTLYFRALPGYSFGKELAWYKQWVTPFIYFFLLCQMLESRRDVRRLFILVIALVGVAILMGMPEALSISSWQTQRAAGLVGQPNDYAALLATMAPFPLLVLFMLRERPAARVLALIFLGCLGLCLLSTYSRAGYIAFGLALIGAAYLAYRGTRRVAFVGPMVVVGALCLTPFVVAPQLLEAVQSRFEVSTYKRAQRKSYSRVDEINQFSGNRLEIWKGAIRMAEDRPLLGVGFHAFEIELPNYWSQKYSNYPHNQFLGALAEGGVGWLTVLIILFFVTLKLLWQHWRATLAAGDIRGQIICGGALLSFVIMISFACANDFFNPSPKTTVFWVVLAGAVKYTLLPEQADEPAVATAGT